jgi:hypothetical protein
MRGSGWLVIRAPANTPQITVIRHYVTYTISQVSPLSMLLRHLADCNVAFLHVNVFLFWLSLYYVEIQGDSKDPVRVWVTLLYDCPIRYFHQLLRAVTVNLFLFLQVQRNF